MQTLDQKLVRIHSGARAAKNVIITDARLEA
jgi:hypothetical protein